MSEGMRGERAVGEGTVGASAWVGEHGRVRMIDGAPVVESHDPAAFAHELAVALLAERETIAGRLEARAKVIREEEFIGPREAAMAFREAAKAIRADGDAAVPWEVVEGPPRELVQRGCGCCSNTGRV